MKILSTAMRQALSSGEPLKLELGAGGPSAKPGYFAIDHVELDGVDALADLSAPLSEIPDNSVAAVYSRHTFEHVPGLLTLMEELHRVCRPDAKLEIVVPHYSNTYGMSDPTHVRMFGIYSMYYFSPSEFQPRHRQVPCFYCRARFKVERVFIAFYRNTLMDRATAPILERVLNRSFRLQELYERRFAALWHAWELRFTLQPLK